MTYDVVITLTRESDKSFRILPVSVSGAIGKGKHAGVRKEIRWEYKRDVAGALPGDDYVFIFNIQIIKEGGGSNLLYYLGGGALVVGGAAVLLLSGSKNAEPSAPAGLPSPPGRPQSQ